MAAVGLDGGLDAHRLFSILTSSSGIAALRFMRMWRASHAIGCLRSRRGAAERRGPLRLWNARPCHYRLTGVASVLVLSYAVIRPINQILEGHLEHSSDSPQGNLAHRAVLSTLEFREAALVNMR